MMFDGCFRIKKVKPLNCGETMIVASLLQKICKYEGMRFHQNELLRVFFYVVAFESFFFIVTKK